MKTSAERQTPATLRTRWRRFWTFPFTGALAGIVAVVIFAWIHQLIINDIWFFIWPMIIAGALCGLTVAASFVIISPTPGLRTWLGYNASFIAQLMLLGIISILVFKPVTTVQALLDDPFGLEEAERLMGQAMPLTVVFALGSSVPIARVFGSRWWHFGPVLVTVTVVSAIFGLNISILGLVETTASDIYLIPLLFGLILATVAVYAVAVTALEWRNLRW